MVNDPIADFLTRLRNAVMAKKNETSAFYSKITAKIAEILQEKGYIDSFSVEADGSAKLLRIFLKYDTEGRPVLEGLKRISRPGLRTYCSADEIPAVRNGMGLSIISTSRGVLDGIEAKKNNVGGEVLCFVW